MGLPLLFVQFTGCVLQIFMSFSTTVEIVFRSYDVIWLLLIIPELGEWVVGKLS